MVCVVPPQVCLERRLNPRCHDCLATGFSLPLSQDSKPVNDTFAPLHRMDQSDDPADLLDSLEQAVTLVQLILSNALQHLLPRDHELPKPLVSHPTALDERLGDLQL